jgi:hypothetical protein
LLDLGKAIALDSLSAVVAGTRDFGKKCDILSIEGLEADFSSSTRSVNKFL